MAVAETCGTMRFDFDNSYARLPERFYARVTPDPVRAPRLLLANADLAGCLGLDAEALSTPEAVLIFAGNQVPEGAQPLAMAYAGHQFGSFVPQLGDGRAILLGELRAADATRFDMQLKGSGRTPFSRSGDGRAAMGPVLREYLLGEAMHALGIPTTRALAAVATGEVVYREQPLPGAVLTRIARGHVRVGSFEYFRAREDREALKILADYVIERHYPELLGSPHPYRDLLAAIAARQAELIAAWLGVGFIHGVMNTDNMSIAGETIDYGPCAFIDSYDPATVFSSIDHRGRYAYGNQARIAHWNLASLAQSLRPLLEAEGEDVGEQVVVALDGFTERFELSWLNGFGRKLGLQEARTQDRALIDEFLDLLYRHRADFTNGFRALCAAQWDAGAALAGELPAAVAADWLVRWRARLASDPMSEAERHVSMGRANPAVIPRNHLVEQALEAAVAGEMQPYSRLLGVLKSPWQESEDNAPYRLPPKPGEVVQYTFCGT